MNQAAAKAGTVELDLSDVARRVGQEVGGGELIEPCSATDIRRWVMAMDYPNPIHWDHEFAKESKFGGIVAPQSFAVGIDYGHGVQPACVGHIPGSHTETKFAGPTLFSRGDTVHFNQHGTPVCKERSTSIRYLASEAEKRGMLNAAGGGKMPVWNGATMGAWVTDYVSY